MEHTAGHPVWLAKHGDNLTDDEKAAWKQKAQEKLDLEAGKRTRVARKGSKVDEA